MPIIQTLPKLTETVHNMIMPYHVVNNRVSVIGLLLKKDERLGSNEKSNKLKTKNE